MASTGPQEGSSTEWTTTQPLQVTAPDFAAGFTMPSTGAESVSYEASQPDAKPSLPRSRYRGVYTTRQNQGKWLARVSDSRLGRTRFLGTFSSEEEAARAFDKASFELRQSKAVLNFPEEYGLDPSSGALHSSRQKKRKRASTQSPMVDAQGNPLPRDNNSGFAGVSMTSSGRHMVRIFDSRPSMRKQRYLGTYDSPEVAARIFDQWTLRVVGDAEDARSRLNFPQELQERWEEIQGIRPGTVHDLIAKFAPGSLEREQRQSRSKRKRRNPTDRLLEEGPDLSRPTTDAAPGEAPLLLREQDDEGSRSGWGDEPARKRPRKTKQQTRSAKVSVGGPVYFGVGYKEVQEAIRALPGIDAYIPSDMRLPQATAKLGGAIELDAEGHLPEPIRLGAKMVLESLGDACLELASPSFRTKVCVYPPGFRARRLFSSIHNPLEEAWYRCEIVTTHGEDGQPQPLFRVFLVDHPEEVYEHSTPSRPWSRIRDQVQETIRSRLGNASELSREDTGKMLSLLSQSSPEEAQAAAARAGVSPLALQQGPPVAGGGRASFRFEAASAAPEHITPAHLPLSLGKHRLYFVLESLGRVVLPDEDSNADSALPVWQGQDTTSDEWSASQPLRAATSSPHLYVSRHSIFPVGYSIHRPYPSIRAPHGLTTYRCDILRGDDVPVGSELLGRRGCYVTVEPPGFPGPVFRVQCILDENTGEAETFLASSPSAVWGLVVDQLQEEGYNEHANGQKQSKPSIHGHRMFGLSFPAVRDAILRLPGVDEALRRYDNTGGAQQRERLQESLSSSSRAVDEVVGSGHQAHQHEQQQQQQQQQQQHRHADQQHSASSLQSVDSSGYGMLRSDGMVPITDLPLTMVSSSQSATASGMLFTLASPGYQATSTTTSEGGVSAGFSEGGFSAQVPGAIATVAGEDGEPMLLAHPGADHEQRFVQLVQDESGQWRTVPLGQHTVAGENTGQQPHHSTGRPAGEE